MMSFDEIGERMGMTGENARLIHNKALIKLKAHMRTQEEWEKLIDSGQMTSRLAEFVMAALVAGANAEKGMKVPRHVQSDARRKFKMAYRKFLRGEQ